MATGLCGRMSELQISSGSSARRKRWASVIGSREIADAGEMEALGRQLASVLDTGDLMILVGELGAGKTTLTRGLGAGLGLRDSVTSPTFVVARTHRRLDAQLPPLIHVDAYRLGGEAEFDDLDLDIDNSIVVVEWGEGIAEALADEWLLVRITRPVGGAGPVAEEDLATDSPRTVAIESMPADPGTAETP